MPVTVAFKNETSGTPGAPKNMSGSKTLTVTVTVTAGGTGTGSLQTDTGSNFAKGGTGTVAAAMQAGAVATTITKVYVKVSLTDGSNTSDFIAGAGTPVGGGVTEYPVTLNIANGDARFNQVCKLVPHAVATGGDTGDFAGSSLNFIKIV